MEEVVCGYRFFFLFQFSVYVQTCVCSKYLPGLGRVGS